MAALAQFMPLLPMIPGLVSEVREIISILHTPALTEEERNARLDALMARLDQRVAEIEAMELPARQEEDPNA